MSPNILCSSTVIGKTTFSFALAKEVTTRFNEKAYLSTCQDYSRTLNRGIRYRTHPFHVARLLKDIRRNECVSSRLSLAVLSSGNRVLFYPLESLQCPWVFVKRHEKQITMKAHLSCNVCLSSKQGFSLLILVVLLIVCLMSLTTSYVLIGWLL